MHPKLQAVTERIRSRSATTRAAYLTRLQEATARPRRESLGCANLAHAYATLTADDRLRILAERATNLGIITAYNDVLSAHQPYAGFPEVIRDEARRHGATVQVAGGTPAMCDGVTQGTPGMELSLFSRDVIAMSTAVGLSHETFDAILLLGVCDKIVPGLLIGALHFGHLPCVFVPAGPMTSGLSNSDKSAIRERFAQGLVGREELQAAESEAYHGPGTCTFYGTANSNQMLLEAMGLHVPGAAFIHPGTPEREALTREAVRTALSLTRNRNFTPIGRLVDERVIVNAMVALLATGGSTNHLIHWVAVARAAGILIDWTDFDDLSSVVPLLASVYPNGKADVNQFQAAGGPALVLRELLDAGLMHEDVASIHAQGIRAATQGAPLQSRELTVIRPVADPFSPTGGLRLLSGNLGRAVIKVSAVPADRRVIEAPCRIFDSQEALHQAFKADELNCDVVVVVRFQGPRANGMPELHKLTPPLSVLQKKGYRVALVTDGRMSGASGTVPAAIHTTPEALDRGPLAKLQDGDVIRLDTERGELSVRIDDAAWQARTPVTPDHKANQEGWGRELFSRFRAGVTPAEEGACSW
jgi:phosphogluconate dehydratase